MKLTAPARAGSGSKRQRQAPTTIPGTINVNKQEVIGRTGMRSTTMEGQIIYRLKCRRPGLGGECGFEYGANGTDVHMRKCPKCQDGQKGEPLVDPQPTLFG